MLKNYLLIFLVIAFFVGCKNDKKVESTNSLVKSTVLGSNSGVSNDNNSTKITDSSSEVGMGASDRNTTTNKDNVSENENNASLPVVDNDDLMTYETVKYPHLQKIERKVFDLSLEKKEKDIDVDVVLDGAVWDQSIKNEGNYSVRLKDQENTLTIKRIPVEEGKWYVIRGVMYVQSLPADVMRYYIEFMNNDRGIDIPNYPMVAISKEGEWEEFILPVYIKKDLNINNIKIVFRNVGEPDANNTRASDVWLDDISMYEVKDSASLFGLTPPGTKQVFDGALVKVDALGNFSLKEGNTFKPFLPIIIYPGGKMDNWDKYKSKGFNTIICNSIVEAKKAVSLGMHWIWSLYDYGIYDGDTSGYARFEKEYKQLRSDSPEVLKKLLYFYWDNERYLLFDTVHHFTKTIHEIDVDESGKRLRPFTMQLDFTTANPHYVNELYQLVDLQSCYANPMIFEENDPQNYQGVEFKGNYDGEFANFAIFEHIPGVRIPKSVFVINSPFGDKHIANTIFAAFARGGRGFAYWKDGGSQPAIETKVWWKDFNQTVDKMQKVLPLLRTPHWTDWKLESSLRDDEDGLVMGTRDFGDKRCMIVASRSNKEEKVRFSGLDTADGTVVIDYFTGSKAAIWKEGAFELSFSARGYGVYCWDSAKE